MPLPQNYIMNLVLDLKMYFVNFQHAPRYAIRKVSSSSLYTYLYPKAQLSFLP